MLTVKRLPWSEIRRMGEEMGLFGPRGWLAFQREAMDRGAELSEEDASRCLGIRDGIAYIEDNGSGKL